MRRGGISRARVAHDLLQDSPNRVICTRRAAAALAHRAARIRRSGAASSRESVTVSDLASMSATGGSAPFGAVADPLGSVACEERIRFGRAGRSRAAPWERHAGAGKNAVALREGHPGLLPYPVGCRGFAVRYP